MNTRISVLVGLVGMFAAGSAAAVVPVVVCDVPAPAGLVTAGTNSTTGHYFEVYFADAITWSNAKQSVSVGGRKCGGVTGHLATITSQAEDKFVDGLRRSALSLTGAPRLNQPEVWIGGVQASDKVLTKGEGWQWDNGEGPISTPQMPLPSYSNWLNASDPLNPEPNDNYGAGSENQLAIGLGNSFGWNDEGAIGSIGGYIVEYDIPRPADCEGTSCQTVEGQILKLPPGSLSPGAKLNFTAYEFTDPRVGATNPAEKCGNKELVLFGPAYGKPELRIPPYLCGSPKFVVVFVDSRNADNSFLTFDKGTVFIENDTPKVLNVTPPGSYPYVCKDTTGQPDVLRPVPGEDPQRQDVVVYQTTDPGRMLESLDLSHDPQFVGAAGEFTNSCGSSRGSGNETSFFVVGMHIDFGAMASTPAGRHDRFVALTRYKLTLLQQSVANAETAGALKNGDATKMGAQLKNAVSKLDRGDPSGALGHVQKFLKFVDAATYTPADRNYNGEHLMRGTNLDFTLRVKVIPNAP